VCIQAAALSSLGRLIQTLSGSSFLWDSLALKRSGRAMYGATAKSRRVIYLPALALKALLAHQAECSTQDGFVFTAADGTPLRKSNFIRRAFKPLLKAAELPDVTFHSLRHTANSLLIEAGEDPLAIAGSLGHADTRMMFERYGHLFSHSGLRVAKTADEFSRGGSLRKAGPKKNPQTLTGCGS
jgi:integrase